jgi:hypothetical protein
VLKRLWRVEMPELHTIEDRSLAKLRGRDRRSLNLSTKLTAVEAEAVEEAASRAGKTPSEWERDLLLRPEALARDTEMEVHLFTELIRIEMLMMKTLEPILRVPLSALKLSHGQLASPADSVVCCSSDRMTFALD